MIKTEILNNDYQTDQTNNVENSFKVGEYKISSWERSQETSIIDEAKSEKPQGRVLASKLKLKINFHLNKVYSELKKAYEEHDNFMFVFNQFKEVLEIIDNVFYLIYDNNSFNPFITQFFSFIQTSLNNFYKKDDGFEQLTKEQIKAYCDIFFEINIDKINSNFIKKSNNILYENDLLFF